MHHSPHISGKKTITTTYDFGLVGLGVMGRNFMLNVADKGFTVFGNDVDNEKVNALLKEGGNKERINASVNAHTFVSALSTPRKIMLLVPAGKAVDEIIATLLPHLEEGDIIVDGGNSFFADTDRRAAYLKNKGIHFLGTGVSGGAQGARKGPSIMPGGTKEAYQYLQPIFEAVAAQYEGEPCVAYLGPNSAGHYVKMVHNGIEYGLMQLTAEMYDLLKKAGGLSNEELHQTFAHWNQGRLQSFLIDISSKIFAKKDEVSKGHLIDAILDKAEQKGTGKWSSQNAMDLGIPTPIIDSAVSMRQISALTNERITVNTLYPRPAPPCIEKQSLIAKAEQALYFAFINTYAQGLHQLTEASKVYGYSLQLTKVAKIWRAGCIIRTALLTDIVNAYKANAQLPHLLHSPYFVEKICETLDAVRALVSYGAIYGIPLPSLSNALSYFDAYTSRRLPVNLIQAQRDYFGSHTYERLDREGIFHTDWEA